MPKGSDDATVLFSVRVGAAMMEFRLPFPMTEEQWERAMAVFSEFKRFAIVEEQQG